MRVPANPSKGYPIAQKIKEILDFLRAERITSVQGGRLQEGPNGKSIIIDFQKETPKARPQYLPFEIHSTSASEFSFAQGVINSTVVSPVSQIVSPSEAWYLECEITFSVTTGEITNIDVYWTQTLGASNLDSGIYFFTIGSVDFTEEPISLFNNYFGPINVITVGGINSKWEVYVI